MTGGGKAARDNNYYLELLQRKHPEIFRDLEDGKYATVAEALRVAGIKKDRTPLQEMLNAWNKATAAERDAFVVKVGIAVPASPIASPSTATLLFAAGGRLQPGAIAAIRSVMASRNLKIGDVMHELGRKRLNASLGMAMNNGSRLRQDLVDDLKAWLAKQTGSALKL